MTRALRRHHSRRLKRNRKNYYNRILTPRQLGMAVTTPQVCSCWACGNQRILDGETRQELLSRLRENDEY